MNSKKLLTMLRAGRADAVAGKIHALDVVESAIAELEGQEIDPAKNPLGFAVAYRNSTGCSAAEAVNYTRAVVAKKDAARPRNVQGEPRRLPENKS